MENINISSIISCYLLHSEDSKSLKTLTDYYKRAGRSSVFEDNSWDLVVVFYKWGSRVEVSILPLLYEVLKKNLECGEPLSCREGMVYFFGFRTLDALIKHREESHSPHTPLALDQKFIEEEIAENSVFSRVLLNTKHPSVIWGKIHRENYGPMNQQHHFLTSSTLDIHQYTPSTPSQWEHIDLEPIIFCYLISNHQDQSQFHKYQNASLLIDNPWCLCVVSSPEGNKFDSTLLPLVYEVLKNNIEEGEPFFPRDEGRGVFFEFRLVEEIFAETRKLLESIDLFKFNNSLIITH